MKMSAGFLAKPTWPVPDTVRFAKAARRCTKRGGTEPRQERPKCGAHVGNGSNALALVDIAASAKFIALICIIFLIYYTVIY